MIVIITLISNLAFASNEKPILQLYNTSLVHLRLDTIPPKQQETSESKKPDQTNPAKPENPKTVVKEVPKARTMPKPKVVGVKVKPVKVIKPKIKPKI